MPLYYGDTNRQLNVRSGVHISISPLTFNKLGIPHFVMIPLPLRISSFWFRGLISFYQKSTQVKSIKHDKPELNKNINSAQLSLFDTKNLIG